MINFGLPEAYILQTFTQSDQVMDIWDSSDSEAPKNNGFWENFSSSDEEDVKGMTRSGHFYEVVDKGKGVVREKKKEEEKAEDVVLRQLKKIPAQVSIWELLCSSQEHRRAMVEVLGRIMVPADAQPMEIIRSV